MLSSVFFCSILLLALSNAALPFPMPTNNKHKKGSYKGWAWQQNWMKGNAPAEWQKLLGPNCIVTLRNASFDLLPLHLKSGGQLSYYSVQDERSEDNGDDDYEYAFNICGAVLDWPNDLCKPDQATGQYCDNNTVTKNETTGITTCDIPLQSVVGKAFAYQIKNKGGNKFCYHLSDETGGPGIWKLLNDDNPSEGVVVSYLDGDWSEWCGHNRQIDIEFICDNDHNIYGIPGSTKSEVDYAISDGTEYEECQYKLQFRSIYGCPTQCPIVGNKVCNGEGLCGYDWEINEPRCYCYSLFTGSSCTSIDITNMFLPHKSFILTHDDDELYVHQFTHTQVGPDNAKGKSNKKKTYAMNVVYDYEEWVLDPTDPYVMSDKNGIDYTYYWNFMDTVDLDFVQAKDGKALSDAEHGCHVAKGPCEDLTGDCVDNTNSGGSYVYQINEADGSCRAVGGSNVTWDLYDSDNPARGVVLTYHDGGYCEGSNKNSYFKLTLLCPDDSNSYVKQSDNRNFSAFVEEDDYEFCGFHTTIVSAFACPDECITDATDTKDNDRDVSICNRKGMCAADPFAKYVHCLCDYGWAGAYCDEKYVAPALPTVVKNMGSYVAAIVIISIVLVAVCYFGYKKLKDHKQKVKELEIKLVNYQSSGGAGNATFHDERPPQQNSIEEMPSSKGASLKDKIKNKFKTGKNKGKYSNISDFNEDNDEQELFNVKVAMNNDDDESDEDDDQYKKQKKSKKKKKKKEYQIGDADEDEEDVESENDDDDQ